MSLACPNAEPHDKHEWTARAQTPEEYYAICPGVTGRVEIPPMRMIVTCCGRPADDKTIKHGWRCFFRRYKEVTNV